MKRANRRTRDVDPRAWLSGYSMTNANLSDDIRRFLLAIPSIPYLETILLLRGAPGEQWDTRRVAQRLFLGEEKIAGMLQDICNTGICSSVEGERELFVFNPQSPALGELIDRVANYYARNLIEVTNMIHTKNGNQRIRQFADAFQWRKGKEE